MRELFSEFIKNKLRFESLVITCGLPATAKSGLAEITAKIKGYCLLQSDQIRLDVLKNEDIFDEKIASNMNKRTIVYDEMFRQADICLRKDNGVILDATFVTNALRRRAAKIAAQNNLALVILQTDCPQEVAIRRILNRTKDNYESNALTEKAYYNNKMAFEKVNLDSLKQLHPNLDIIHLIVATQYDSPEDWYITSITKK
ncbi:MAG: ATP-binding protein [Dehalococcoidales bacterium]|nr:ATP-binding protein [Dehalococcoidales bacterium]